MLKISFFVLLIGFGCNSNQTKAIQSKGNQDSKIIDIDKLPQKSIDYKPETRHRFPTKIRNRDTLKYTRNTFSVYKWDGNVDNDLGTFDVFSFSFYLNNRPINNVDSIFLISPIEISSDSTKFTYALRNGYNDEELPDGNIYITDIQTQKTLNIHTFDPINGPFFNDGLSFLYASKNTIYRYDLSKNQTVDSVEIQSSKGDFNIFGLKLLDKNKVIRIIFKRDEENRNKFECVDIPLSTFFDSRKKQ